MYRVTANIIHNILACECRQGVSATRLGRRVPNLNAQTDTRDTDFLIYYCFFFVFYSVRQCDLSTFASCSNTPLISCVGSPESRRSASSPPLLLQQSVLQDLQPLSQQAAAALLWTNPDKLSCSACARCSAAAVHWGFFFLFLLA